MINAKENLLIDLLNEKEVKNIPNIIKEYEGIINISWRPYGNNKANKSIIQAQQSNPNSALVELLTNSMDAISERRCKELGLDPKSSNGLPTVDGICKAFFNNDAEKMSNYASIRIFAEALPNANVYPNIIIADNGVGQLPEAFESTLLSLSSGIRNKHSIPFEIGSFNMGSTGSLRFCGNGESTCYKLICSKRHSDMNESYSAQELERIGYTIIRQTLDPSDDYMEYLLIDNEIPFITEDISDKLTNEYYLQIDAPCKNNKSRFINPDAKFLDKGGTLVKLYNYQTTTPGVFDSEIAADLNSRLYKPVYSVYCGDTRDKYVRESRNTTIYGNFYRFRDPSSLGGHLRHRKQFDITASLDGVNCEIPVTYYVMRKDEDIDKRHLKQKGLLYTMNGQVQYSMSTTFISNSKYLGFTALAGRMLVVIDCTNIKKGNFFMSTRENIVDNRTTQDLMAAIINALKNDEELCAINKEYISTYSVAGSNEDLKQMARYLGGDGLSELTLGVERKTTRISSTSTTKKSKKVSSHRTTTSKTSSGTKSGKIKSFSLDDAGCCVILKNIKRNFFYDSKNFITIEIFNEDGSMSFEKFNLNDGEKFRKCHSIDLFKYSFQYVSDGLEIGLAPDKCAKGSKYILIVQVHSGIIKFRQEIKEIIHVIDKKSKMPFTVRKAFKEQSKVDEENKKNSIAVSWDEIEANGDWIMDKEKQNVIIAADGKNVTSLIVNMDSVLIKSLINTYTRGFHYSAETIAKLYFTLIVSQTNFLYQSFIESDEEYTPEKLMALMSSKNFNAAVASKIVVDLKNLS